MHLRSRTAVPEITRAEPGSDDRSRGASVALRQSGRPLVMPGMSGAEVVERLRRSRTDITAIVVSDYVVPELMQRAAANGAFA